MTLLLAGCGRERRGEPPGLHVTVPQGDVAAEVSWSPDQRCAAFLLSNKDGHSPMTTTRVAVVEPSGQGYRELRLPEPNARFSTVLDGWESAGVLRLHATTLDGDIVARYHCASRTLEVLR